MNETLTQENLTTADIADPKPAAELPSNPNLDERIPPRPTEGGVAAATGTGAAVENSSGPLFPENELKTFRSQWDQAQGSFVDEPRKAVEQADSLVANVVKRIAEQFAEERAKLEKQWDRGDDVSTEDLRQALRRYRAFFDRLLSF
jgi:hypothetical protein